MDDTQKAYSALRYWLDECADSADRYLSLAAWSIAKRLSKTLRTETPELSSALTDLLHSNSGTNAHEMNFLTTDPVKVLSLLSRQAEAVDTGVVSFAALVQHILNGLPEIEIQGGLLSGVASFNTITQRILGSWNSRTHEYDALAAIEEIVWATIDAQVLPLKKGAASSAFSGNFRVRLAKPDWKRMREIVQDIQQDKDLECRGFRRHSPERKRIYDRLASTKRAQAERAKDNSKYDLYELAILYLDEELSVDLVEDTTQP